MNEKPCTPAELFRRIDEVFPVGEESPYYDKSKEMFNEKLSQWTSGDGNRFYPAGNTFDTLPPATYSIDISNTKGLFFRKIPVKTEGLIQFPETNSEKVISEIKKFWELRKVYQEYNIPHKRGILLLGPPGSGKSSTIQLIMADVILRGGVVFNFGDPGLFTDGIRIFREIQPETPLVVLMEDIDSTLEIYSESEVLNILDGVEKIDRTVFLATTNYPERLGQRIINRPSRFDRRFKMPPPGDESRKIYFKHLMSQVKDETIKKDIEKKVNLKVWVEDTDGMSIAHLKELFSAVCILGDPYDEAIEILKSMDEEMPDSKDDKDSVFGFQSVRKTKRRRGDY